MGLTCAEIQVSDRILSQLVEATCISWPVAPFFHLQTSNTAPLFFQFQPSLTPATLVITGPPRQPG